MFVVYRGCMLFFFVCYGDHRDLHVLTHSFPTRRSSDLCDQPKLMGSGMNITVLFIHGEWLSAAAWDNFSSRYRACGYTCIAPPWPLSEGDRKSTRLNSSH